MARVTSSSTATDLRAEAAHAEDGAAGRPTPWRERLRRFGYTAPPRADARERLLAPFPTPGTAVRRVLNVAPATAARLARWADWGGPLLVALFAGVLRLWDLGRPREVIFDETYYAKDAWSLWQYGYEATWDEKANEALLADPPRTLLDDTASYVVHPPVGKWTIGFGEWLGRPLSALGDTLGLDWLGWEPLSPFGWRISVAVLGTLSVLMVCRIGRRLFRSTALGCLAGLLLAVDGLHLVMSRTALLDMVVMFWLLAAFGCLLVDRDHARARLAAALPYDPLTGVTRPDAAVGSRLPLGWRPWRLAAGVCLGLACATKWNGAYVLAAFGVMTVLWDVGARRTAGARSAYRAVLRRDALPAFCSLVPVAVLTYLVSWTGWFATRGGYFRDWAERHPDDGWSWVPAPLRSLWHYHTEVYHFHVNLTSSHTYESNPFSWLVLGRPVSYYYESATYGEAGCGHESGCSYEVLALGTPLLWWAACGALVYLLYRWAARRDWRAGAVLCGVAAGYLPWFLYQERTIFYFYAVVLVPFLCLALAMAVGAMLGPPGSTERRRAAGAVAAGTLVLLIVWNFIYFWPIYTGGELPLSGWRARMWLDTWV